MRIPSRGAAIAALIRRDHVIAGVRKNRHHLAPAESEFGEAVQQQKERAALGFVASFQHMHAQAVDAVDIARAYGWRERDVGEGGHDVSSSWPGIAVRRTASLTLAYARPSTSSVLRDCKDVDARDKPGHDADSVDGVTG